MADVLKVCDLVQGHGELPIIKVNVAEVLTSISPPDGIALQFTGVGGVLLSLQYTVPVVPPSFFGTPG